MELYRKGVYTVKHNYCTIISYNSLYRGLLLYDSLLEQDGNFRLFVICMQDGLKHILEKMLLKNVKILCLSEIENQDQELAQTKNTRSEKEYAWTSKASILLYLLKNYRNLKHIVYVDADIYFFSNPKQLFDEFKKYSIFLTRERFFIENNFERYKLNGNYNGGFLAFKKDKNAIQCLELLRVKCLNWCFNKLENGLYGDQVYLNEFPYKFNNVGVSKNIGINVNAWYAHASYIEKSDNKIYINDIPVIFYHYNGLVLYNQSEFDLCVYINLPSHLIQLMYMPYLKQLHNKIKYMQKYNIDLGEKNSFESKSQYIRNYYKIKSSDMNE